jgi:hypothetical protein
MVQNFNISALAMAKVEKVNIADIYKARKNKLVCFSFDIFMPAHFCW